MNQNHGVTYQSLNTKELISKLSFNFTIFLLKKQVLFWRLENDFWKILSECDVPLCSECSCSKFGLGECRYSRETNFRRQCVCEDGAILHAGECISKDSDKIENPNECQPEDDCGAGTCNYKAGNQYFRTYSWEGV